MTTSVVELSRDRTAHARAGYVLVMPNDAAAAVPLCCPVCLFAMSTAEDEAAFLSHSCCHLCELEWVQPDRAAWAQGVRPSAQNVADAVLRRPPVMLEIAID